MAQSLDALSLEDRLATYRGLAEDALRQAATTYDPGLRAGLLSLAASWQRLANEIETIAHRIHDLDQHRAQDKVAEPEPKRH